MARVLIVGAYANSLVNSRGELLKSLAAAGHDVITMAAPTDESVVERILELGARFRHFPVQRSALSPFSDLKTLFALRRAIKELKPDVILAYTIKPVIWGGGWRQGPCHGRGSMH